MFGCNHKVEEHKVSLEVVDGLLIELLLEVKIRMKQEPAGSVKN